MSHLKVPLEQQNVNRQLIPQQGSQRVKDESPYKVCDDSSELNATCELDWSQLIYAEIISVTSAMRKNSRWSGMSVSGLNMGGLGMSMGLRGRTSVPEVGYRNQVKN